MLASWHREEMLEEERYEDVLQLLATRMPVEGLPRIDDLVAQVILTSQF